MEKDKTSFQKVIPLHYKLLESKENLGRLLFLHGALGQGSNWLSMAQLLVKKGFSCLLPDLRGHGRSGHSKIPKDSTADQFCYDLLYLLDSLQWQSLTVIGHSLGGRLAVHLSHLAKSIGRPSFKRLILVDIGPESLRSGEMSTRWVSELLNKIPTPFTSQAEVRHYFSGPFTSISPKDVSSEKLGAFLKMNLERKDDGQIDWRFDKKGILFCLEDTAHNVDVSSFKTIPCPTFLLRGEYSQVLSDKTYRKLLTYQQFTGVTISESGHWVHSDQPEVFFQALLDALLPYSK